RGPQVGYNSCDSPTENQNSMCHTSIFNGEPHRRCEEVAWRCWCSKPGHSARLVPNGALQSVQLLRTLEYIQIAGFIDQTQIDVNAQDYGGQLDPHGADLVSLP
ncbi:hypothetical protein EV702DRAFT_955389, partial [Suillus placidus]